MRHLRAEWRRWWQAEDLTDAHIGHMVLNDQYRIWRGIHQRTKSEVHSNIGLLRKQQRQNQAMQMQRMEMMKHARGGGRRGGFGMGLGMGLMGGSSPMIAHKTMQWAELEVKISQREFEPTEVTPGMLAAGRDQVRARRHRAAAAWLLVLLLAWIGVWPLSPLAGLVVTAVAGLLVTAVAWAQGRNPTKRRPPVPKLLFVPPKSAPELEVEPEPEPFALREAGRTPKVVREAVRLALAKEGAAVDTIETPEETSYGWRVPLVLSSGTVADIVKIVKPLATTLRVGANRVLARPMDRDDAARVELKLLPHDPFAEPLPYPPRRPLSASIRNPVSLGLSIDGETTPVVLAGQHIIIIAKTGGGKTAMVQAIAEYITACVDAVVVDIDPAKRGLKALAPLAVRKARGPEEAEAELEYLLALAQDRIASLPPTQDSWEPTPEGPAVLAVIDEFTKLSQRGKDVAVDLLRLGREARVTIVLCAQDATRDALGDSIADSFGIRILMPCRAADVPLVVGRSDALSQGWLPHLLIPSPDPKEPEDAGQFYAVTPKHRDPILRYVSPLPPDEAASRAKERLAAGLPTLAAPAPAVPVELPDVARLLLEAFTAAGDPEILTLGQIADHLAAADPKTWGQWEHLEEVQRRAQIGRQLRQRLTAAGLEIPAARAPGTRQTAYKLKDVREALVS